MHIYPTTRKRRDGKGRNRPCPNPHLSRNGKLATRRLWLAEGHALIGVGDVFVPCDNLSIKLHSLEGDDAVARKGLSIELESDLTRAVALFGSELRLRRDGCSVDPGCLLARLGVHEGAHDSIGRFWLKGLELDGIDKAYAPVYDNLMALARGVRQRRFDARNPYGLVLVLQVFVSCYDGSGFVLEDLGGDECLALQLVGVDLKGDPSLATWPTWSEVAARLRAHGVNTFARLRVDERTLEGVCRSGHKALV